MCIPRTTQIVSMGSEIRFFFIRFVSNLAAKLLQKLHIRKFWNDFLFNQMQFDVFSWYSRHLCSHKVMGVSAKNKVLRTDKKSFQNNLCMSGRTRTYVRGNARSAGGVRNTTKISLHIPRRLRPYFRRAPITSRVKRLSRTEECPVNILRSKCGARVRDFDVEHIELLIAQ